MLPFMSKKKIAASIMQKHGKSLDAASEVEAPNSSLPEGLKGAAEDIMQALQSKSAVDLASALHKAFMICDASPHVEGEHEDMESES